MFRLIHPIIVLRREFAMLTYPLIIQPGWENVFFSLEHIIIWKRMLEVGGSDFQV